MSINSVALTGNLTRNSELRYTADGVAVLAFTVAINDKVKDSSGEWVDRPVFVDCVTFGKRATALAQYLLKGVKVTISGKLRYSRWEKDGETRSKVSVAVSDLEFMSRKGDQLPQPEAQPVATAPAPEMYEEEIPF